MAGLLYLPRIFVYHSQNSTQPIISEVFKVMEKKLFFYIMTQAMTLSWLFGLLLIHEIGFQQLEQTWMILKLIFVAILTAYHFYLGKILGQFANVASNLLGGMIAGAGGGGGEVAVREEGGVVIRIEPQLKRRNSAG